MSLGGSHFDLLKLERLARAPADGGLTFDDFALSVRHESRINREKRMVGYL